MNNERAFKTGCRVIFIDSLRQPHEALVTCWHNQGPEGQTVAELEQEYKDKGITTPVWMPCCNIVYVSGDETKEDPYGRQIERQSSCTYGGQEGNPEQFIGNCWCWPDELEEALRLSRESYAKTRK